jgi:hypothetical protein
MTKHVMPQRLAPAAPIGSLLKRAGNDRPAMRNQAPADLPHLAAIRQLPCLKCGLEPCGEAAHVKKGHVKMGRRPPDSQTVPLCRARHQTDPDAQHRVGEEEFWGRLGINPLLVAKRLFEVSGDVVRMRAVVLTAIAERVG